MYVFYCFVNLFMERTKYIYKTVSFNGSLLLHILWASFIEKL